jgi:hypothetical protein
MKTQIVIAGLILLIIAGCHKESPPPPQTTPPPTSQGTITLNINYSVDSAALLWDTIVYKNAAGFKYSVTTLQYFLSDIYLIKQDSSKIKIQSYYYADASIPATGSFSITNVLNGNYIGICFNIGLDSALNIFPGGLPDQSVYNDMQWFPSGVPNGGGYHFLKFEGNYVDTNGLQYGFAMHLGSDSCLIKENPLYKAISINNNQVTLTMTMNLNEWFRNPYTYNFDTDGSFSMGNMPAMLKLVANGAKVFHF